MTNDSNIKTYTLEQLAERRRTGETLSDLTAVRAKTEEELERDIASDPDWADVPPDWYERAELVMPDRKRLISLRLDEGVVEWFREQGPGYQTRMNAVLRIFVEHATKRRRA